MSAYSTDKVLENAVVETNQPVEQSTLWFSEREKGLLHQHQVQNRSDHLVSGQPEKKMPPKDGKGGQEFLQILLLDKP